MYINLEAKPKVASELLEVMARVPLV